jgi:AcrR family transcriptional regulator
LLDAAVEVFLDKGVEAATVADVARAAGMAKGSVYRSFSSKEEMLAALKDRFLALLSARAEAIFLRVGRDDLWGLTDEMVGAVVDFNLEHRELVRLFADAPLRPSDGERRIEKMLITGIQVGQAAGLFDVEDPALTALMLMEGIQGATRRQLAGEGEVDRDRLVAAAQRLARRALGGDLSTSA